MIDPDFKFRLLVELSDDWLCLKDAHFCFQQIVGTSYATHDAFVLQILALIGERAIEYGDIGTSGEFIVSAKIPDALATELKERLAMGATLDHCWFAITDDGMNWLAKAQQGSDAS
jgi:hypothetical protein